MSHLGMIPFVWNLCPFIPSTPDVQCSSYRLQCILKIVLNSTFRSQELMGITGLLKSSLWRNQSPWIKRISFSVNDPVPVTIINVFRIKYLFRPSSFSPSAFGSTIDFAGNNQFPSTSFCLTHDTCLGSANIFSLPLVVCHPCCHSIGFTHHKNISFNLELNESFLQLCLRIKIMVSSINRTQSCLHSSVSFFKIPFLIFEFSSISRHGKCCRLKISCISVICLEPSEPILFLHQSNNTHC